MTSNTHRSILLAAMVTTIAMAGAGCSPSAPVVCTAEVEPAIIVEIRDARNNQPLAQHAVGFVRDGAYTDALVPRGFLTADPSSMVSRSAAYERPGLYDVEVQLAGYHDWSVQRVRVASDVCHVNTVTLHAALQPPQ